MNTKKIISGKMILISVVSLLIIAIFTYPELSEWRIESFSKQVFEGILQGKGQVVWNYSTIDFRNLINHEYGGLDKFGKFLFEASKAFKDLESWEIANVMDFGDAATVQINMKYHDKYKDHRYFLYLKKENGEWKLDRPRVMDT